MRTAFGTTQRPQRSDAPDMRFTPQFLDELKARFRFRRSWAGA